jgi:hypothetical protein
MDAPSIKQPETSETRRSINQLALAILLVLVSAITGTFLSLLTRG